MIVIADDIMVVGKHQTIGTMIKQLQPSLKLLGSVISGLTTSCSIKKKLTLGETYTTNGHKPAQSKVKAITEMPAPT